MSRRLFTRMAARDAWRNKWRSLLMVVMVALPVAAVTALDVVVTTADVKPGEAMSRTIGAADAKVMFHGGVVQQRGANWNSTMGEGGGGDPRPIEQLLGRDVTEVPLRYLNASVTTTLGRVDARGLATDWNSPLVAGLTRLTEGRLPQAADEVAVNAALVEKGPRLGAELEAEGHTLRVVGVMEDATERADPYVFTSPVSPLVGKEPVGSWLLGGTGGVDWADTKKLNKAGYVVASAALVADPPADSELNPDFAYWDTGQDELLAVLALVVVMVLLEVVLLAGPGFAVTARRMQHSLALLSVSGATPRQARRAVMAMAWVMGLAAALVGLLLGLGLAGAALHFGQPYVGEWFAPMQVPVGELLVVAALGVLAALLAAWMPARLASKQDPVATLSGRRGDPPGKLRNPLLGLVLLGVGLGTAALGASRTSNEEFIIALSALLCVLAMVLLLPVVLGWVGRLAGRLPLSGRYALRDAIRHRSRTVPAIAAVAATVAGAVALGIAVSSDEKHAEATYSPSYEMGMSVLSASSESGLVEAMAVMEQVAPQAKGETVRGVPDTWGVSRELDEDEFESEPRGPQLSSWGGMGLTAFVDETLPEYLELPAEERQRGNAALSRGEVVVFSNRAADLSRATLEIWKNDETSEPRTVEVDSTVVVVGELEPTQALALPPTLAVKLGLPVEERGAVYPDSGVTRAQKSEIDERFAGTSEAYLSTELGYVADPFATIVTWSLVAVAAVLMLGGTLTSTLLSLSDARGDLTTLASVGAEPRTRRRIAAWYALVIAGVGSTVGAAVGFIPGIAVSFPLTRDYVEVDNGLQPDLVNHYLDIPWLAVALVVVALPLVSAAVMALFTRSRLPLMERA